jgi:hypothetical protein
MSGMIISTNAIDISTKQDICSTFHKIFNSALTAFRTRNRLMLVSGEMDAYRGISYRAGRRIVGDFAICYTFVHTNGDCSSAG